MEKRLEAPLRIVVDFLENRNYRYAIIGGIALARWGVVRATYDIAIKVLVPNTEYARMRTILRAAFPIRAREHAPENPLIISVSIENVIVDFLLSLPGYEELIIERAVQRDMGGIQTWLCSAEDLIIQKIVVGRRKDWDDVEALLNEQKGKLDENYIEDWLTQFADVLEKQELLLEYKRLLEKIKVE
jgi:hypothetical protein